MRGGVGIVGRANLKAQGRLELRHVDGSRLYGDLTTNGWHRLGSPKEANHGEFEEHS